MSADPHGMTRSAVGPRPSGCVRFGPAGWSYADWAGIVYPRPRPRGFDPLRYLASYFDTVEINSTFYRPATCETALDWAERVADAERFSFTAKLWRRFTHERDTAFTRADVEKARAAPDALASAGKLGALLLQFPWSFRRTEENRIWLDDVTRAFADFPLVLEVRHASWNVPEFYGELVEQGIGFVNIDQPLFRQSIKPSAAVTSPVGYVRVHGRNYSDWFRKEAGAAARYDYLYAADELKPWAERTAQIAATTRETYVVTNNHFHGKGIANALMLESMVRGRRVEAPATVVANYRDVLEPYVVNE